MFFWSHLEYNMLSIVGSMVSNYICSIFWRVNAKLQLHKPQATVTLSRIDANNSILADICRCRKNPSPVNCGCKLQSHHYGSIIMLFLEYSMLSIVGSMVRNYICSIFWSVNAKLQLHKPQATVTLSRLE